MNQYAEKCQNIELAHEMVGITFIRVGRKHLGPETIVNVHKVVDLQGSIVKWCYVTSHTFCGQVVYNYDVSCVTVARADIVDRMTGTRKRKRSS